MRQKIIHLGGLFPPSFGPAKTLCGLKLPCDRDHFAFAFQREPRGSRRCKRCAKKQRERAKFWRGKP